METWNTAGYLRLSREDGDKSESDSIANQRKLLEQYLAARPELHLVEFYQDDGYTGTSFDRPAFRRMEADIEEGRINCVVVKDLSRFGRDYIEMGRYLERVFPARGVRFIAVNDHVDSRQGRYDMLLPMKNIFNTQYARDISDKVRAAIHTKQQRGEFVGAFPSYGYQKDPANHSRLVIDPAAAQVVRRIFDLFEQGWGKIKIARQLNAEGIPSPSEYKRILGERYHNGRKIGQTTYWTYATIHRILQNQMYAGNMEQGRNCRPTMHGRAVQLERSKWAVVPGTHEAIIGAEQWERVQALLRRTSRSRKPAVLTGQDLQVNCDTRDVTRNGEKIDLTFKEFELLKLLMENSERVMTRSELLNLVWGIDFEGETRTLDMHIRTLRQKLGDDADNPRYIHTVRGVGYRFCS